MTFRGLFQSILGFYDTLVWLGPAVPVDPCLWHRSVMPLGARHAGCPSIPTQLEKR